MLCLRLKKNESIVLGDPSSEYAILLSLYKTGKDCVKLGIQAPRGIAVDRICVAKAKLDGRNKEFSPTIALLVASELERIESLKNKEE